MAEALLSHYISENNLEGKVISRGLAAPIGRAPHEHAIFVAGQNGIPINPEKRAAAVTSAEIAAATVVLIMDAGHRKEIQLRFPAAIGKTFQLGQWQNLEIADPINEPLLAFETAWRQCDDGARSWVEKLREAGLLKAEQLA